jgi:hypothetical protein
MSAPPAQIKLLVDCDGKQHEILCDPNDTVETVRYQLFSVTEIPPEAQDLSGLSEGGAPLRDGQQLKSFKLKADGHRVTLKRLDPSKKPAAAAPPAPVAGPGAGRGVGGGAMAGMGAFGGGFPGRPVAIDLQQNCSRIYLGETATIQPGGFVGDKPVCMACVQTCHLPEYVRASPCLCSPLARPLLPARRHLLSPRRADVVFLLAIALHLMWSVSACLCSSVRPRTTMAAVKCECAFISGKECLYGARVRSGAERMGGPNIEQMRSILKRAAEQSAAALLRDTQSRMEARIRGAARAVLEYEQPELKAKALAMIPVDDLQARAQKAWDTAQSAAATDPAKAALGLRDHLLEELLKWFRGDFFKWCDTPPCGSCGKGTSRVGVAQPNPEEAKFRAGYVEVSKCNEAVRTCPACRSAPGSLRSLACLPLAACRPHKY